MEKLDCWVFEIGSWLIIFNGSPTNEFKILKGLRQGDPLSPFILAMEAFNIIMQEAKSKNIFEGIEVGKEKVSICHLRFTDDTLITGKW